MVKLPIYTVPQKWYQISCHSHRSLPHRFTTFIICNNNRTIFFLPRKNHLFGADGNVLRRIGSDFSAADFISTVVDTCNPLLPELIWTSKTSNYIHKKFHAVPAHLLNVRGPWINYKFLNFRIYYFGIFLTRYNILCKLCNNYFSKTIFDQYESKILYHSRIFFFDFR